MQAQLHDLLTTLYRKLADAELRLALDALAADVEWVIGGGSALAGAYQGREEVGALWSRMDHLGCLPRPGTFFDAGNRAVVLCRVLLDGVEADVAEVFDFEGGLVSHYLGIGYPTVNPAITRLPV